MKTFRVFGFNLASDFPFATHLDVSSSPPDLTFSYQATSRWDDGEKAVPIYVSPYPTETGEPPAELYRLPEQDLLRFPGICAFRIEPHHLHGHAATEAIAPLVEIRLLGPALSYWLEGRGLPILHASAVEIDGRALVFAADQGGGKSGLAAALLRSGAALLSDDVVALETGDGGEIAVRSAYPEMRMWPDEARHFLGNVDALRLVQPGAEKRRVPVGRGRFGDFSGRTLPLQRLYLPERRKAWPGSGGGIFTPLSRREALIELVRLSFMPHLVEAVGLQPGRLDLLSRLVQQVSVRRLLYPAGFERLEEVAQAIRQDAAQP
ncbi:MAG TPA: hypothetical protein VMM92_14980 [Thermoanaerobaculia bacterium]|nr:hypothetical protein [Thermoanaerobaculia bacterium]